MSLVLRGVHAPAQFIAGLPEGGIKLGLFGRHGQSSLINQDARIFWKLQDRVVSLDYHLDWLRQKATLFERERRDGCGFRILNRWCTVKLVAGGDFDSERSLHWQSD